MARPAVAQQTTLTIHGTITTVQDVFSYFDSSVHVGTPYTAVFQINSAAPNVGSFNDYLYASQSPLDGFTVTYGNYKTAPNPGFFNQDTLLDAYLSYPSSSLDLRSLSDPNSGTPGNKIEAFLYSSGAALTQGGLPPQGPGLTDINLFQTRRFTYYYNDLPSRISGGFFGTIDSLSVASPVPEASTTASFGLLLALGLGGLVVSARRKKAQSTL